MSIKLDQALVQSFIDGAFGLPIAHENTDYVPVHGTPFAELAVFQNEVKPFDLNTNDNVTGLLQIILRYPQGGVAVAAKAKADEILTNYKIGNVYTYGGQALTVTGRQRFSNTQSGGWYEVGLRVNFVAFTAR